MPLEQQVTNTRRSNSECKSAHQQNLSRQHGKNPSAWKHKSAGPIIKDGTMISNEQRRILSTYARAERVFPVLVKTPFSVCADHHTRRSSIFDGKAVTNTQTEKAGKKESLVFESIALDDIVEDHNNAQRAIATQEAVVESFHPLLTHQGQKDRCCSDTLSDTTPHDQTNSTQPRTQPWRSGLSTRPPRQPIHEKKTRSKKTVPQKTFVNC